MFTHVDMIKNKYNFCPYQNILLYDKIIHRIFQSMVRIVKQLVLSDHHVPGKKKGKDKGT